jgi:putative hemolysin
MEKIVQQPSADMQSEIEVNKPISREIAKSRLSYAKDNDPLIKRVLIKTIERLTGRPRIERLYTEMKEMDLTPQSIWQIALDKLEIYPHFSQEQLDKIPKDGPVLFVSNHPFGVADGLMLGLVASKIRPKFGILVNEVLCTEEMFKPYFLPIDFRETKEALETIINTRKETIERLERGEAIAIFPSGGVATAKNIIGPVEDLEWKRFVLKLVQKSKATVVPLFFHGQNSFLFQLASHIHPNFRLGLLLNEVRNKMNRHIGISIGDPLSYEDFCKVGKNDELLHHLHKITWEMKEDPFFSHFRSKSGGARMVRKHGLKHKLFD